MGLEPGDPGFGDGACGRFDGQARWSRKHFMPKSSSSKAVDGTATVLQSCTVRENLPTGIAVLSEKQILAQARPRHL